MRLCDIAFMRKCACAHRLTVVEEGPLDRLMSTCLNQVLPAEQSQKKGDTHAVHQSRPGELWIHRPVLRRPRLGTAGRPDPWLSTQRPGPGYAAPRAA